MELATRPIPMTDQLKTVADYWQYDEGWLWGDLEGLLPLNIHSRIAAVQVYPNMGVCDKPFWGGTSSGSFSIQSAIDIQREDDSPVGEDRWKTLWRIKAPQKMKMLLWIILHGGLMTNEWGVKRGLTSNAHCHTCPTITEDTRHILRTCSEG